MNFNHYFKTLNSAAESMIIRTGQDNKSYLEGSNLFLEDSRLNLNPNFPELFALINAHTASDGKSSKAGEEHPELNRAQTVLPFDKNRVTDPNNAGYYINASRFKLLSLPFVTTQAPLEKTIDDFFKMIHLTGAKLVINLVQENCHEYWKDFERVKEGDKVNEYSHDGVTYLHYHQWRDMESIEVGDLMNLIDTVNKKWEQTQPLVVHCRAGIGRTGTLIASLVAKKILNGAGDGINIPSIIRDLRRERAGMVQTPQQLEMIFNFVEQTLAISDLSPEELAELQKFAQEMEALAIHIE